MRFSKRGCPLTKTTCPKMKPPESVSASMPTNVKLKRKPRPASRQFALKHGARAADTFSSRAYILAIQIALDSAASALPLTAQAQASASPLTRLTLSATCGYWRAAGLEQVS